MTRTQPSPAPKALPDAPDAPAVSLDATPVASAPFNPVLSELSAARLALVVPDRPERNSDKAPS